MKLKKEITETYFQTQYLGPQRNHLNDSFAYFQTYFWAIRWLVISTNGKAWLFDLHKLINKVFKHWFHTILQSAPMKGWCLKRQLHTKSHRQKHTIPTFVDCTLLYSRYYVYQLLGICWLAAGACLLIADDTWQSTDTGSGVSYGVDFHLFQLCHLLTTGH